MALLVRQIRVRMPRTDPERYPTVSEIRDALIEQCDSAHCPVVVETDFHGNPVINNCLAECDFRTTGGKVVNEALLVQPPAQVHPELQQRLA